MSRPSDDATPDLLPTDRVLLQAHHLAARRPRPRGADAVVLMASVIVGLGLAVGWASRHGAERTFEVWALGSTLLMAAWIAARLAWARLMPSAIDEERLARHLVAEALLALDEAGVQRLRMSPEGLQAEPGEAPMPWPDDSPEAALRRARRLAVARLVADWRGGRGPTLAAMVRSAERRGIVRVHHRRRGPSLEATPEARHALARLPAGLPSDGCRRQRPALWHSLVEAVADGAVLAPTADVAPSPAVDPRAPAGVDRYGVPLETPPWPASVVVAWLAAAGVAGALAVARLSGAIDGSSGLGWPPWPLLLGAASALALFAFARRPWEDEPLPPAGHPEEEAALTHRRRRRVARPRTPPALPWRLLGASAGAVLVGALTLVVTPLGVVAIALAAVWHARSLQRWGRLQQLMPSPREVALAVARRSKELSAPPPSDAAPPGGPSATAIDGQAAPPGEGGRSVPLGGTRATDSAPMNAAAGGRPRGASAARSGAAQRPSSAVTPRDPAPKRTWLWLAPDEWPQPAAAQALRALDRPRRQAAEPVHAHLRDLLLHAGTLALVAFGLAWQGRTPGAVMLLCLGPWLACLAWSSTQALRVLQQTRATAWRDKPGWPGQLLGAVTSRLPSAGGGALARAGQALRRAAAEPPDVRHARGPALAAPLGAAPRVLTAVTAALGLLMAALSLVGPHRQLAVAGAAMILLTVACEWRRRRRRRRAQDAASAPRRLRLVLLRVFGSPSFDDLLAWVEPWLLCGPVAHLEGYDSVGRSAEVRTSLALDHLDAALVHTPEELARRISGLHDVPGDDGRFRREAFQCTDAIWRDAIRVLLERSDRVLMDLSGFGPTDLGCAYELGLLLDRTPLSRVLLLVDETSDLACLAQVLDAAEARIDPDSPNAARPPAAAGTVAAPTASSAGSSPSAPARPAWRLLHTGGRATRHPGESREDWLRRMDTRLAALAIVHGLLGDASDGALPRP